MRNMIVFLSMGMVSFIWAIPPVFDTPVALQANGSPINVGYGGNASPFMFDWNGDGKKDLLVGQEGIGSPCNVYVFLSRSNP